MRILKTYTGGGGDSRCYNTVRAKPHQSIKDGGTTQGITKSGTIIFVEGEDAAKRKRALQYFLKVYNNDFSTAEQKKNGDLIYKLTTTVRIKGKTNTAAAAIVGVPDKIEKKKYHIVDGKILILRFSDSSAKMGSDITHELIHIRKYANNQFGNAYHNEQKIDFESVGRMTKKGIKQTINPKTPWTGTYYNVDNAINKKTHSGNPYLAKLKLPQDRKLKIASEGLVRDRKLQLLTGSINTNIVGKVASSRAEKLFPKSFFNIKYVIDKKKK
jgi:hypothetical protein